MQKVITSITIENKENYLEGLYLDIETTGLSKERSILSMIGCLFVTDDISTLIQWFNDNAISEEEMLLDFYHVLKKYKEKIDIPRLITFNGERFDLPYLLTHFSYHKLSSTIFEDFDCLDLYQQLLPFQKAFQLEHGRQKDWEYLLDKDRKDPYSGKELIQIYKNYLKTKQPAQADAIFLHNKEDLLGLFEVSSLSPFFTILKEENPWTICEISPASPSSLKIICKMHADFPVPLQLESEKTTIYFYNNQLIFTISYIDETLKHFYSDYQNYYYLLEEDYAVHKSIGCYVDSSHRQKATASSCYIKKEGIFFLLPAPRKKYGLQICKESYQELFQYRLDYSSKESYLEFDDLMKESNGNYPIFIQYLKDWTKTLLWK